MEYKQVRRGDLIVGSKVIDGIAKCHCLFKINNFIYGETHLSLIKKDLSCTRESHKMNDNNHFVSLHDNLLIKVKDIYCI